LFFIARDQFERLGASTDLLRDAVDFVVKDIA
jgi:hypothetical protein